MAEAIVRGGKVQMLDRAGSPVAVPEAEIHDAYARGFTVEPPESVLAREAEREHGGVASQILTAAEGAASGLTFGVSDQALVAALGDDYRKNAAARAATNPLTRSGSEIGGAIAPAVVSGGSSLAARAALGPGKMLAGATSAISRAGGRSILGRAVTGGAAGALEGAAFSAGRANAEAALGGTELTADKILAAAKDGALWGAAGGAVFGAGSAALSKAGRGVLDKFAGGVTLRQALDDAVSKRAAREVVGEALEPAAAARLGKRLLANKVPTHDPASALKYVNDAVSRSEAALKRVTEMADNVVIDARPIVERARSVAADLRATPVREYQQAAKYLEQQIKPLVAAGPEAARASNLAKLSQSLASAPRKGARGQAVEALQGTVDDTLDKALTQAGDGALHRAAAEGDTFAEAALREQRTLKEAWRQAVADNNDWHTIKRLAERKTDQAAAPQLAALGHSTALGVLTGVATGDIEAGAAVAVLGSRLGSQARKYALERGLSTVAKLSDRLVKAERAIDGAAKALVTGETVAGKLAPAAVSLAQIKERVAELRENGAQKYVEPLAAEHPELALAVQTRMLGDADYLASHMPPSPPSAALALQPARDQPEASPIEERRTLDIAQALDDPRQVFQDLARGVYNPDQVQAVKQRRPALWADVQTRVQAYAAAEGDEIPFERRALLSLAFDFPADWSYLPSNLGAIQALGAEASPQNGPQGPQNANIDPSVGARYALPSNPVGASA